MLRCTTSIREAARRGIRIVPVTLLQQNCSLIWDTNTKHAVLVDPGGDVDTLMGEISGAKSGQTRRLEVDPVGRLNRTLAEHYEQKLAWYAVDTDTRYDKDLLRIFSNDPKHSHRPPASKFLRHNRVAIRESAWRVSGAYQIALDNTIDLLISRARALKLRAPGREYELRKSMVRLLNTKVAHQLHTSRRQWFAV